MSDQKLSDYLEANVPVEKELAPSGWEPGITWDGERGTLSTGPMDSEPDSAIWTALIEDWGLDPKTTETIPGSVQVRGWDANVGNGVIKRLKYYRASICAKQSVQDQIDINELIKSIGKKKAVRPKVPIATDKFSVVVPLSDWQIGKGEGGGTPAATERVERGTQDIVSYIRMLKKQGKNPEAIYLIGLGDLIENCTGHYAMQTFKSDIDVRSQKRVVRRLILNMIDQMLIFGIPVVLGAVPGNHGERRVNGKAYTTLTDNEDLAVIEEIAEIISVNPERYKDVFVPNGAISDDLTMTLNVSGVNVGFAHGHQMRGGGSGAQAKIERWFHGQALGKQRVADAQILFSGHLHHLVISEATGRTIIQCPAMDGGSQWFTGTSGASSPAGMIAVCVGKAYGRRGWGNLEILGEDSRNV